MANRTIKQECVVKLCEIYPAYRRVLCGLFDKKEFKKYQGYVRAFEALEARLLNKDLTREQEKYMAERNKGKRKGN